MSWNILRVLCPERKRQGKFHHPSGEESAHRTKKIQMGGWTLLTSGVTGVCILWARMGVRLPVKGEFSAWLSRRSWCWGVVAAEDLPWLPSSEEVETVESSKGC